MLRIISEIFRGLFPAPRYMTPKRESEVIRNALRMHMGQDRNSCICEYPQDSMRIMTGSYITEKDRAILRQQALSYSF